MAGDAVTGRDPATGRVLAVAIADGRIAAIDDRGAPGRDGGDLPWLAPGLVDLQVNGYGGTDLNDGTLTAERVCGLCRRIAGLGVTAFLPTLITAATEQILDALAAIAEARRRDPLAARMVAGVHVEGPAISPHDGPRGAHPAAHVRPPSLDEFRGWQRAGEGLVKLVTLAPEWPGAAEYIRAVTAAGTLVSLGHSAATSAEIARAADAGASLSTHLGNGVAAMLPRHPNLLWAQLADDRLSAMVIADGHHLPAETLRVFLRAKGAGRLMLVSDSVALAGMPPGRYDQPIGGAVEVGADGRIGIAGTGYLAGAGLSLLAGVGRAMAMAGLTLDEALTLATVNPGRILGGRGRLAIGAPADLILLRQDDGGPQPEAVWSGGHRLATP